MSASIIHIYAHRHIQQIPNYCQKISFYRILKMFVGTYSKIELVMRSGGAKMSKHQIESHYSCTMLCRMHSLGHCPAHIHSWIHVILTFAFLVIFQVYFDSRKTWTWSKLSSIACNWWCRLCKISGKFLWWMAHSQIDLSINIFQHIHLVLLVSKRFISLNYFSVQIEPIVCIEMAFGRRLFYHHRVSTLSTKRFAWFCK